MAASDAHVDPPALVLAHAPDLPLLQRAQQLDLHAGRDLADFVEQQRPAVGRLEQARAVLRRAGERAARVAEELALEQGLGDGAAVDRDERPRRARGLLVDQPRDPLLARSALAGDEHGGIDLGHPARHVHQLPHGGALGDDPQRLLDVARHANQRSAVLAQLALGRLQRLRDPLEGDIEAFLEAVRLEEAQLLGALVTPFLARAPEQVAGRVALAHAAIFEDIDLLAGGPAEVAAGQPADGPAHGRVGATEMQEVLFRLVGGDQHHALLGQRVLASRLDAEQAFEGVDARARAAPVFVARPT